MVSTKELSLEDKVKLLDQLYHDKEVIPYIEAEYSNRLNLALKKLDDQIEAYIKEIDKRRSDQRKNLWTTSLEGMIAQGWAEVLSRVKAIIKEIRDTPEFNGDTFEVMEKIRHLKNSVINNSLSNRVRGTRSYPKILRWEGELADILESGWKGAFLLGLEAKSHIPEERLKEIKEQEYKDFIDLCSGSYDKQRVWSEVMRKLHMTDDDETLEFAKRMIPQDPSVHPEVMEFLKSL